MSKLKVAVIGTRGFPGVQGGIESHCENLYPLLAASGCDVTVFGRRPHLQGRRSAFEYKGVKIVPLACPKNKFLETFVHTLLCVCIVLKRRPDIVHVHAVGPSLFIPLLRLAGLKVVMTNHGPDYERRKWGFFARLMLKAGEALGSRYASSVIAISKSIEHWVMCKYGRRAVYLPNGVQTPVEGGGRELIERLGLTPGKFILAVGRLVPEKGFHDLIAAFRLLKETGNDVREGWKLVIAGKADHHSAYSRELQRMAQETGDVVLAGFLEKESLHQLYREAGIFVLPSYCEGLSIALLEALSHGCQCIASDIEANRIGLVEDSYFKAGDPSALYARMRARIDSPVSRWERDAQAAAVRREYDWEAIARRTLELYASVARMPSLALT